MKNCVYRFLNKNNEIIYIGKALDLKQRLKNHNHLPEECYEERVHIEYIKFKTEDDMNFAERYFILKCNPKYNTILADKDFNLNSIELEIKKWEVYDENNTEMPIKENNDDKEDFVALMKEYIKIEIQREAIWEIIKNVSGDNSLKKLDDELREKSNKLYIKIEKVGWKQGISCVEEYLEYHVWCEEDLIKKKIEEIKDEYLDRCKKDLNEFGYYKEEIYELIDKEFIYIGEGRGKWKTLLKGEEPYWTEKEKHRIDEELKNSIVNQIIKDIEKSISMQYGELERDVMVLDGFSEINKDSYPNYRFMKFKKPFIVYKIKQVA